MESVGSAFFHPHKPEEPMDMPLSEGRPRQDSTGQNPYSGERGGSFAKMKNVLEVQKGASESRESLENGEEMKEQIEVRTPKTSRSPSGSPQVSEMGSLISSPTYLDSSFRLIVHVILL